jgi:hypothetical protein
MVFFWTIWFTRYGFSNKTTALFQKYLIERKQITYVNNFPSDCSILGPLLGVFIIKLLAFWGY